MRLSKSDVDEFFRFESELLEVRASLKEFVEDYRRFVIGKLLDACFTSQFEVSRHLGNINAALWQLDDSLKELVSFKDRYITNYNAISLNEHGKFNKD